MTDRKSPTGALALLDRNRLSDVRFIAIASSVFVTVRSERSVAVQRKPVTLLWQRNAKA